MQDHIEHFVLVSRRIRRISRRHLAEETANRPPIDRLSVGRRCAENLRRHIVIGSADAVVTHGVVVDRDVGRVWVGSFLLAIVANAKVAENDVALTVQKNVFRLDIAVDNDARVKVFDRKNDFGDVITSDALGMEKR